MLCYFCMLMFYVCSLCHYVIFFLQCCMVLFFLTDIIIEEPWMQDIINYSIVKSGFVGPYNDDLFVNFDVMKISKKSSIYKVLKPIIKYLRKYNTEFDPTVLYYLRRVLYGLIRNDKIAYSRNTGRMICSSCFSPLNFSDDICNQKVRMKKVIFDISSKFEKEVEVPWTSRAFKKKFIQDHLSLCISYKHEANIHCLLSKPSTPIPNRESQHSRKDTLYLSYKEMAKCIEGTIQAMLTMQDEIQKDEEAGKSEDEKCIDGGNDGGNESGAVSSDSSGINADAEAGISDNSY